MDGGEVWWNLRQQPVKPRRLGLFAELTEVCLALTSSRLRGAKEARLFQKVGERGIGKGALSTHTPLIKGVEVHRLN